MRMSRGLALSAIMLLAGVTSQVSAAPAAASNQQAIPVFISTVQKVKIPRVLTAFGTMQALQQVDLSFVQDGQITQILANSGLRVKKDQEIAALDDSADQAQLRSLQAQLELQQSTYKRMLELQKYGGVSNQVIDQTRAELVAAQAAVQQQQVVIAQKKLYTPFDGVLGIFQYDVGAYLPRGTTLVRLVQQAPLLVRYSVPATYKSIIEIGQEVQVRSNVYPDKVFSGILSFIALEVNANSSTVTLQAKVDNPDYLLAPGMFVSVVQVIDPNRELVVVPAMALMTDINGQYVYKVVGNHVVKTYVKVGVPSDNYEEIRAGLQVGDQVVSAGQQKLVDGSLITISQEVNPNAPGNTAGSGEPNDASGNQSSLSRNASLQLRLGKLQNRPGQQ